MRIPRDGSLRWDKLKAIAQDNRLGHLILHVLNNIFLHLLVTSAVELLPLTEKKAPSPQINQRRSDDVRGGSCPAASSKLHRFQMCACRLEPS